MDYALLNDIFDDVSQISDDELADIEDFLTKDRRRAHRRVLNIHKARHRRYVDRKVHYRDWYSHLHQYSKGKIHCSCNLCRFRPNWDPDNKPIQDVRNLVDMNQQLRDFNENN